MPDRNVRDALAERFELWKAAPITSYDFADRVISDLHNEGYRVCPSEGFMVVADTCPTCGRWLDLSCPVDGPIAEGAVTWRDEDGETT